MNAVQQQPGQGWEGRQEEQDREAEEDAFGNNNDDGEEDDQEGEENDDQGALAGNIDNGQGSGPRLPILYFGQFEAGRMDLKRQERQLAKRIKEAVQQDPENDMQPLSDFMYAQIAIVTLVDENPEDVDFEKVLERVRGIQALREEYRILDTYQNGAKMLQRAFIDLLPGFMLNFDYVSDKGAYLAVSNLTCFDMSIFADPEKVKIWLAGMWYINHAHTPDFAAARQGILHMVECRGYDWKKQDMFHLKAFTEFCPLTALYPFQIRSVRHFNTGMFVHLLGSVAKKLLPRRQTDSFDYVQGSDYGNLDELFGIPTPEAAGRRVVAKLQESLRRRYDNEASYSLG